MYKFFLLVFLVVAYIGDAGKAYAYIDPGTGSILLQGVVGTLATGLVVIRIYGAKAKRRVLAFLGRAPAESEQSSSTPE